MIFLIYFFKTYSSCQNGFACIRSTTFDTTICCSQTNSATDGKLK